MATTRRHRIVYRFNQKPERIEYWDGLRFHRSKSHAKTWPASEEMEALAVAQDVQRDYPGAEFETYDA